MARDLRLEVVLAAIDKATKPIKSITQGSVGLARTLKTTRDTLKGLQSQQKDISSFKSLKGANEQTQQAMRASTDRVKALSRELANTSNPTKALNNEFKRAVRESQSLKQKHGEQQRQLQTLRGRLSDAGISTKNLSQHERDLRQKLVSTNQTLKQQEDRLKRVTDQQNRMAKAKASYEKSQRLAGSMAASGAAGLAAGSGVLYGTARMIQPGIEFDTTMSKVQALARLDREDEQLQALRDQARQLGATTMFSAGDAASGMAFLAMAGFTPEAIAAAMPGLLDMSKAGDVDLGRTADIASNILSGFKIDPAQMGMVADVLTKAFTTSNTTLEGLGDTMGYVGPIAAKAGMSLEEAAAMAGLLGNIGIQSSKAGTTLRAMLLRLSAPAGPAAKKMAELGISAKDSEGNIRSITEVLGETAQAIENMGSGEQLEALKAIFGEEPASGMAELIDQAGAGGITKYLDIVKDYQGAAALTAKTMGDNLTGDLDELSSVIDDVRIEVFEQLNDELRSTTRTLSGLVGRFGAWAKANPATVATIIKVTIALAALVAAGGALTIMIASVIGPLAMIRYGMTMLGIQGAAIIPTFKAIGMAVVGLGKAMLTTPLGLIVAALVVGAILLVKHWDKVKAFFGGFVGGFLDGFKAMAAALRDTFAPLLGMLPPIRAAIDWVVGGLQKLLKPADSSAAALEQAAAAGASFGRAMGALTVLAGVAMGIKAVGAAIAFVSKLLLINPVFLLIAAAVAVVAGAAYLLYRHWGKVSAFFLGLWQQVKDAFAGGIGGVSVLLVNWSPLGLIYKAFAGVMKFFNIELPGSLTGAVQALWGKIRQAFAGGIGGVSALIVNWSPLGLFYKAFAGVLGWFGIELPETFSQFGAGILSSLCQGLLGGATSVMEFFGGLWQQIKDAFAGGIGGVSALIVNWSPLGLFYQAFAGVMNYFGVDLPGKFTEFGGMLMNGMVQGIKNGLGAVKDSITGAGDAAVGWFKDKLGIRSPSRVFAALGDDTMAGLESGLERSKSGPLVSILEAGKALAGAAAVGLGVASAAPAVADQPPQPPQPALPELVQVLRYTEGALPQPQLQPLSRQVQQHVQQVQGSSPQQALPELVQHVRLVVDAPAELIDIASRPEIRVDSRPPLQAAAAPVVSPTYNINISVQSQPGMDEAELARLVAREMQKATREAQARSRSALYDND